MPYVDQVYSSPDNPNPTVGVGLAQLFARIVSASCAPGSSICDLGCGNGYLAGLLAERECQVVGVDASTTGISVAQRHYASPAVTFLCASIDADLAPRLGSGRFDAVVSSDVIEHLYAPGQLTETAAALLRPGGVLLVGTPYHGYWKNLALSLSNKWDAHHTVAWDGGHIKFFSVATLGGLVRQHGFADLRFHFYGRVRYLWKNMICQARKPDDRGP